MREGLREMRKEKEEDVMQEKVLDSGARVGNQKIDLILLWRQAGLVQLRLFGASAGWIIRFRMTAGRACQSTVHGHREGGSSVQ
jgi:hypothetical protein